MRRYHAIDTGEDNLAESSYTPDCNNPVAPCELCLGSGRTRKSHQWGLRCSRCNGTGKSRYCDVLAGELRALKQQVVNLQASIETLCLRLNAHEMTSPLDLYASYEYGCEQGDEDARQRGGA